MTIDAAFRVPFKLVRFSYVGQQVVCITYICNLRFFLISVLISSFIFLFIRLLPCPHFQNLFKHNYLSLDRWHTSPSLMQNSLCIIRSEKQWHEKHWVCLIGGSPWTLTFEVPISYMGFCERILANQIHPLKYYLLRKNELHTSRSKHAHELSECGSVYKRFPLRQSWSQGWLWAQLGDSKNLSSHSLCSGAVPFFLFYF